MSAGQIALSVLNLNSVPDALDAWDSGKTTAGWRGHAYRVLAGLYFTPVIGAALGIIKQIILLAKRIFAYFKDLIIESKKPFIEAIDTIPISQVAVSVLSLTSVPDALDAWDKRKKMGGWKGNLHGVLSVIYLTPVIGIALGLIKHIILLAQRIFIYLKDQSTQVPKQEKLPSPRRITIDTWVNTTKEGVPDTPSSHSSEGETSDISKPSTPLHLKKPFVVPPLLFPPAPPLVVPPPSARDISARSITTGQAEEKQAGATGEYVPGYALDYGPRNTAALSPTAQHLSSRIPQVAAPLMHQKAVAEVEQHRKDQQILTKAVDEFRKSKKKIVHEHGIFLARDSKYREGVVVTESAADVDLILPHLVQYFLRKGNFPNYQPKDKPEAELAFYCYLEQLRSTYRGKDLWWSHLTSILRPMPINSLSNPSIASPVAAAQSTKTSGRGVFNFADPKATTPAPGDRVRMDNPHTSELQDRMQNLMQFFAKRIAQRGRGEVVT